MFVLGVATVMFFVLYENRIILVFLLLDLFTFFDVIEISEFCLSFLVEKVDHVVFDSFLSIRARFNNLWSQIIEGSIMANFLLQIQSTRLNFKIIKSEGRFEVGNQFRKTHQYIRALLDS